MSWGRLGATWKSPPETLAGLSWPRGLLAGRCSDKMASKPKVGHQKFSLTGGLAPELSRRGGVIRPLVPTDMPQHSCWARVGHHGPQAKEGVVPAPAASPPAAPLGLPPGREGKGQPRLQGHFVHHTPLQGLCRCPGVTTSKQQSGNYDSLPIKKERSLETYSELRKS